MRRSQILNAAAVVFAETGFAASRISDVAAQAGVAQGTIYRFFTSKEDLATALFELGQQACREELTRLIEEMPDEPLRAARAYIRWYAGYLARRRGIVVALFSWELDPSGRGGADIGTRPWIAEQLTGLLERGGIKDPVQGADIGKLMPMTVYGLTAFAHLYQHPEAQTTAELARTVNEIACRILGIAPED